MKQKRTYTGIALFVLMGLLIVALTGHAGNLEPSSPPGSTMKTLDEVEARIPIKPSDMPITIGDPGCYYLTGNFRASSATYALFISTEYVTVDLNGYSLNGNSVGTDAIYIDAGMKYTIRNGYIFNWSGIGVNGEESERTFIKDVHVDITGGEGIFLGNCSTALECTAANCNVGFQLGENCTITKCSAQGCTNDGFNSSNNCIFTECISKGNSRNGIKAGNVVKISDCQASDNGAASSADVYGIKVGDSSIVRSCIARNNGTSAMSDIYGISAGNGCTVTDNTVYNNGESAAGNRSHVYAIELDDGCTVVGNTVYHNGDSAGDVVVGIALGGRNLVDQNTVYDNGHGAAGSTVSMLLNLSDCVYGINVAW